MSNAGEEDLYADEDQFDEVKELVNLDKIKKITSPQKFDSVRNPKKSHSQEMIYKVSPSPGRRAPSHSQHAFPPKNSFSISKLSQDENYEFEKELNRGTNRSESPDLFADDSLANADDSFANADDSLGDADGSLANANEPDANISEEDAR